jgi:hypothetical protein
VPFIVGEFVAHNSRLRFWELESRAGDTINRQSPIAADANNLIFTSAFGE